MEQVWRGSTLVVRVRNPHLSPLTAQVACWKLDNTRVSVPLPHTVMVPAEATADLVHLEVQDRQQPWSPACTWQFLYGRPDAVHDDSVRYLVPVDPQAPATMYPFGDGTKDGFLFGVPKGTRAFAARGGVIFYLGPDIENRYMARILHADGTIANYIYLDRTALTVAEGETVHTGQPLGVTDGAGALLLEVTFVNAEAFRFERAKIRFNDGTPEGFVPAVGSTVGG